MTLSLPADDPFDASRWFDVVLGLAETHARRCGLDQFASDLAQHAFALLWERRQRDGNRFSEEQAEVHVRSAAEAERHARETERRHLSVLGTDGRGSEPPDEACPRFARLACAYRRSLTFRRRLGVAAHCLARHPKVLLDDQFRLFDIVWVASATRSRAAELLALSEDAVRQRLRRVSRRLHKCLLRDLEPAMPASKFDGLRSALRTKRGWQPPPDAVVEATLLGLGQVIHSRSLLSEIE